MDTGRLDYLVALGRTAEIYTWDETRVIKLYSDWVYL